MLHDVAPARADGCERVLAAIHAALAGTPWARTDSAPPMSWLVVPHLHGDAHWPGRRLKWLREHQGSGVELLMHGLTHRDEAPRAGLGPGRWVREHYTAGEGEFAALTLDEARSRMRRSRAWALAHGLSAEGFVAPAWLLGPHGLVAARAEGFTHTCTLSRVIHLHSGRHLRTPAIVYSTRSEWRLQTSLAWNACRTRWHRRAPVLRLDLHPGDADAPAVRAQWMGILRRSVETGRRLCTLAEVARGLGLQRPSAPAPSAAMD